MEDQLCYDGFCLNAWNGGPYVNEYTPGVVNNNFDVVPQGNGIVGLESLVTTPDPAGTGNGLTNELNGVRCASANGCWAVGTQIPGDFNLNQELEWNGSEWSAQ